MTDPTNLTDAEIDRLQVALDDELDAAELAPGLDPDGCAYCGDFVLVVVDGVPLCRRHLITTQQEARETMPYEINENGALVGGPVAGDDDLNDAERVVDDADKPKRGRGRTTPATDDGSSTK